MVIPVQVICTEVQVASKVRKQQITAEKKSGTKQEAQTRGQFERDPKRRVGQYSAAGDPPLTKR